MLDAAAGLFTATAEAAPFDVASYVWAHDRSPLTTPHCEIPPIHEETAQAAFDALSQFLEPNAGRFGPLVLPETPGETFMREAAARHSAGIVPETPEQADERLVAANPTVRPSHGVMGLRVSQARARIVERKEIERAANARKESEDKKAKRKALLQT